ncbi:beta-carotene isomerase chloroplastic-like [Micractinium conductrix]|uniref:Beta-carotene isomerase chloroplastic-like n=1 Tax=Micractinium conductrix TaxID=554055 RepID=A0A2P6VG59_9CHLO|nr:beta-carotene isomerase chloroplastic-like [Micractinium conductrix]|eukprot:PSC73082.1 beta-carotene isomerase chloroplastic-like [Micractinium conductrix]
MIYYFSSVMSKQLGGKAFDGSWDGFVDLSREIMRGRGSKEQQETVAGVLGGLLPPQAPERFRRWFPLNKRNAEFNAFITVLGFAWLVGPSELKEVEVDFERRREKWMSGVKIKKCRYLESSGCVGMCTNMCKLPTQKFFTETFGLPLTMNPNFEDLSCEMIFGEAPPPVELDKVYDQPCFLKQCNLGTVSSKNSAQPCPKIDTDRAKKLAAGKQPELASSGDGFRWPWQPN